MDGTYAVRVCLRDQWANSPLNAHATAIRRLRHYNRLIDEFKRRNTRLARLLD